MAKVHEGSPVVADPVGSLPRLRPEGGRSADAEVAFLPPSRPSASPSLGYHLRLLRPWRGRIVMCAVAAGLLTYFLARFMCTHWYRAEATLRPASQEPQESFNMGSMLSSIVGGGGGGGGTLGNIFGTGAADANEMEATLAAVEFNLDLINRYKLEQILMAHTPILAKLQKALFGATRPGKWSLYLLTQARFRCDFDANTGNMTLSFIDPDPQTATRILGLFIDRLRERLRARTLENTKAAIKALENQIRQTSDALMVAQLDQLLAQQLQQIGTAEVQSDFAFVVIDPPMTPEVVYSPRSMVDAFVALLVTPLLMCIWLVGRDWLRREQEKV